MPGKDPLGVCRKPDRTSARTAERAGRKVQRAQDDTDDEGSAQRISNSVSGLLVSGHDLKFLKPLFARMKEEYDLIVQEQSEYTDFSVREAKRLRQTGRHHLV